MISCNIAYDKKTRLASKHEALAVYESWPGHCADEVSTNPANVPLPKFEKVQSNLH